MDVLNLSDNRYAIFFPYHMVTERTVAMATPRSIMREVAQSGKRIKFAAETEDTAGKKRMDSAEMQKTFPVECALVKQGGYDLKKYVLIQVA